MASDQETELKFLSSPEAARALQETPLLAHAQPGGTQQLNTIYFDTPDHSLKDKGIVVRVRRSGNRLLQSVKYGAGITRGEWEHELDQAFPDPALVGDDAGLSILHKKKITSALQPIFETDVERTSYLCQSNGAQIEVSFDQGEIKHDGQRLPINELELELREGAPSELFAIAEIIVASVPVTLSFVSKAERGFLLAEGAWGKAQKASTPELVPGMEAGEAFKAICHNCLHMFMLNTAMFEGSNEAVELVHQSRIAIRRLRAAMSFFKPIACDADYDGLRQELKWISDLLGAARDLDVWQTQTLVQAKSSSESGLEILAGHLEDRRREAHAHLRAALSSERLRQLLLHFTLWLERDHRHLGLKSSASSVESFLDGHLAKKIDKLVKRGRDLDELDEKEQHALRIRAKKLRYTAEFFESLVDGHRNRKAFNRVVGALEDMQSALGEIHDSVALSSYVASSLGGEDAHDAQLRDAAAQFAAKKSMETSQKKHLKDAQRAYEDLPGWRKFWNA